MVRVIRIAAVLGAVTAFAMCAAPAPAAKGVKKSGAQHVSGKIVAVQHGKKRHGTVTIQLTHQKQKRRLAAARQAGSTRTFTVSHTTRIQGTGSRRHGLAGLHPGERVTIAAHQQHAHTITVHHLTRNKVARR